MNTFGSLLAWGGLQVTLLAMIGAAVYALARRRGPAAGSLVALASLLVVLAVSVLVVSPWPRWYSAGGMGQSIAAHEIATTPSAPATIGGSASYGADNTTLRVEPAEPASQTRIGPASETDGGDARATAAAFWQAFLSQLRPAPVEAPQPERRWPLVVAGVLAAALILGIGRLAVGLCAVRRLRAASTAIADQALRQRVESLCRQLGFLRTVEVRESAEVTSPATVGWRRPLLILPSGWRAWSQDQREAVLAHEIAHVQRGDYAAALLAQLCLAVHYYHPLVHWLTRRLRLEQELAADALGARLAGGREQYLRSLAALALAQDNRRVAWSARPFLPAPGTLLRRIEMLRDRKKQLQASLSWPFRVVFVAVLIAAGLGIAGVRGPGGEQGNVAQAAPPEEKPPQAETPKPFSLDYVPVDANFVLAVRPQEIARHEALKPLLPLADAMFELTSRFGMSLNELDEFYLVRFIRPDFNAPDGSARTTYENLFVFKTIKPFDINKQAESFLSKKYPRPDAFEIAAEPGGIYLPKIDGRALWGRIACMAPDDHTFVVAPSATLRELATRHKDHTTLPRWSGQWKSVASDTIAMAIDLKTLRAELPRELPPTLAMYDLAAPLWRETDVVVAGGGLNGGLKLHATATCASADGAEKVRKTAEAVATLLQNTMDQLRTAQPIAEQRPEETIAIRTLGEFADPLLKAARFTRAGNSVNLEVSAQVDLAVVGNVVAPAVVAARIAAQRTQSTNNLKRIGLAFHEYHDVNGKLPPAVVIGPDGKTPHSWRVELLPFLEGGKELYNQYKMDEPWDSENNRKVLEKMPAVFRDPGDDAKSTNTSYFAITGDKAVFSSKEGTKFQEIRDGTSNTIMVVEAKRDVPWTKPEDIAYDPAKPLPKFGGYREEGFLAAFCDGSVQFIGKGVDEKVLRALLTKAGRDVTQWRDIPQ